MHTHPCVPFFLCPQSPCGRGLICDREVKADSEYKFDLPSPVWIRQACSLRNTISKLCWVSFWIPNITLKFTLLKNQALQTSFPWKERSLSFFPQRRMRNTTLSHLLPGCFGASFLACPPSSTSSCLPETPPLLLNWQLWRKSGSSLCRLKGEIETCRF